MRIKMQGAALAAVGTIGSVFLFQSCLARRFENPGSARVMQTVPTLAGTPLLDALDVSILIPNEVTDQFPMSRFLTEAQFGQVIGLGEGRGPAPEAEISFSSVNQLAQWRIVSMRYDPCAPGVHAARDFSKQSDGFIKDDFCQAQVRLIAQPFLGDSDQDVTMHLLYAVGKDSVSLDRQIRGLQAIKKASEDAGFPTTGLALQIHPGLRSSSVVRALGAFLAENCKPQQIRSVAVMGLAGGGPEPWTFYATRPSQQSGELLLAPLPTVENDSGIASGFQAVSFISNKRIIGAPSLGENFAFPVTPEGQVPALLNFTREPILPRSTAAIMNNVQGQVDASGRIISATFDDSTIRALDNQMLSILHAVDNPEVNHFFTMDCASCHTSANLLLRRHAVVQVPGAEIPAERALIESGQSGRFQIPKGVTAYVEKNALQDQSMFGRPWSLRNFGYFQSEASIAFRTATETAEVVADINTEIIGSPQAGPNACAQVSGWERKDAEVWKCIQFTPGKDSKQCLAEICGGAVATGADTGGGGTNAGAPLALLQSVGSKWRFEHGSGATLNFKADAQVIEPQNHRQPRNTALGPFTIKFFVRHSSTDVSNLGFGVADNGRTLLGIRYNAVALDPTRTREDEIRMTWNDAGGFYEGTMKHDIGRNSSETVRLTPVR